MLIALSLMMTILQNPPAPPPTLLLTPYPQLLATRYTTKDGLPLGEIKNIFASDGKITAVTSGSIHRFDGKRWNSVYVGATINSDQQQRLSSVTINIILEGEPANRLPKGNIKSAAKTRSGEWWVVTDKGAFRGKGGKYRPLDLPRLYKPAQPEPHIDSVLRQVFADRAGHVWIATDHGVIVTDGADWWQPISRADGMPYEDVLCVAVAPNGDVWGGTTQGAWRLRSGQWRYFWGRRWLPGNRVNAIAFDKDGAVWLATDGGAAKIAEKTMALAEKAAHYEEITNARHNRRGWVTGCTLKVPGNPNGGFVHEASDNDGLWTAIYIGAESFRYAVTKDPKARELARKSLNALLDLTRLSGYPGFPARAMMRKGEEVYGYNPEETVRVEGETEKIWYASPKDPNLLCKGDTSSDELDGHYFAWRVYYDLVADEEEKKAIREVCRAVTTNILDHEYNLVGPTGRKTRWGVFGPQFINDDPRWHDQRPLNSLQMLDYLKIAHSLCGDRRFADAYEELIQKHHYLLNTFTVRINDPWYAVNYSDDELAYLNYYSFLLLERDPQRRNILLLSLAAGWQALQNEDRPFYNFAYGALTGQPCNVERAVAVLQDWPWELVDWQAKNSHRLDVNLRGAPGRPPRDIDRALPMGERRLMRWNGSSWEADGGGNGSGEEDGGAWLLAYWLGRYHKIIQE